MPAALDKIYRITEFFRQDLQIYRIFLRLIIHFQLAEIGGFVCQWMGMSRWLFGLRIHRRFCRFCCCTLLMGIRLMVLLWTNILLSFWHRHRSLSFWMSRTMGKSMRCFVGSMSFCRNNCRSRLRYSHLVPPEAVPVGWRWWLRRVRLGRVGRWAVCRSVFYKLHSWSTFGGARGARAQGRWVQFHPRGGGLSSRVYRVPIGWCLVRMGHVGFSIWEWCLFQLAGCQGRIECSLRVVRSYSP